MSFEPYRIDEKTTNPITVSEKGDEPINDSQKTRNPNEQSPFLMCCGLCKENGEYVIREFTNREEYYAHRH